MAEQDPAILPGTTAQDARGRPRTAFRVPSSAGTTLPSRSHRAIGVAERSLLKAGLDALDVRFARRRAAEGHPGG
jgi:hypothetical protein